MSGITSRKGDDIAAEVTMMRSATRGPFVIVEGPTDERFFAPRLLSGCYVAIGSGRRTVEDAAIRLDGSQVGLRDYIGVIDEDYDWLIGYNVVSPNVIKTDPRDIEGLFFKSHGLDCVLAEYGDRNACQDFQRKNGQTILNAILLRAEPFGRIRMVNSAGPMVDIKSLKPQRFFGRDWSYDMGEAVKVAVELGVSDSVSNLRAAMSSLNPPDIWHCVRGHDMVDILVGGLLGVLGAKNVDTRGVERILRQSISPEEFAQSLLYTRLKTWGDANRSVVA